MIGFDLLGLGSEHFTVEQAIRNTPTGWAIGAFAETFGDVRPNLRRMLTTGKFPACRVHLWWSDTHKIAPLAFVKEHAPKYEEFAQEFPDVRFYLSHSCEYDEPSKKEIKKRADLIMKLAPSCIPVSAPLKSPVTKGTTIERHGASIKVRHGAIASLDGADAADVDTAKWMRQNTPASIRFLWGHRFNLRQDGRFIPPKQRTAAPDALYYQDLAALAEPPGNPPKAEFTGKIVPFRKPNLWKIHAEDKVGNDDPRANKPLLICSFDAKRLTIVTFRGHAIAALGLYGAYDGGGNRYYSAHGAGSGYSSS